MGSDAGAGWDATAEAGGDATAEAAIRVEGLTVRRGGVLALDGVSCRVPRGQVTGLLGPSGSGKSTLMRAVVGVQVVTAGTVTVLGLPAGCPPLRSRVGYQTQAAAVYPDLTVRGNLRYFARILAAPDADVDRVIDEVDLRSRADRVVSRLSGGETSRVALATGLLGSPEVLVLDEPTVGLDPVLRRDLWAVFHRLAGAGVTLLVSSHVMEEASRCDRILLLRDGRLLADEVPARLLAVAGATDMEQAFLRLVERADP